MAHLWFAKADGAQMIAIGIGNTKGGVGSTTLTFQLAALLQCSGMTVTTAETSPGRSGLHWCGHRAEGAGTGPRVSVG